jgi:protein gp37
VTYSKIEWTDKTWNPTRGCSRKSTGCEHCFAERQAYRFSGPGMPYEGLVTLGRHGPQWTGKVALVPEMLAAPLSWRKPARVFVNSMSDLFHEELSNEEIAAVFGVMAACPQHTFQCLTKRARRMREWFEWVASLGPPPSFVCETEASNRIDVDCLNAPWPLENVHLGVSVENQHYADERIPDLLVTPAAVRFVSAEPLLESIDLDAIQIPEERAGLRFSALRRHHDDRYGQSDTTISLVICGGESGPGARPFDIRWAESVVAQCREAGVACFVKQLGSRPYRSPEREGATGYEIKLRSRKGNDPSEWPEQLRVREFPRS